MTNALPETILQFGSGKFLRGFADLFIHQANQDGQNVGRVVVVQTTGAERANQLNTQGGRYHVAVRGLQDGQVVDRVEESASISRALVVSEKWSELLDLARSPRLRYVLSNTAEAGYNLDAGDRPDSAPPTSFPAKLLLVLKARFDAKQPGVTILPCELFERNADLLRDLLVKMARDWQFSADFVAWLQAECSWHNALVDRIVALGPLEHPTVKADPMAVVTEPYALWALEARDGGKNLFRHPALRVTPNAEPFFLRKVRILNAAHTALVTKAVARGIPTVREAVTDPAIEAWLKNLLFDEIVPTVEERVEDAVGFANQTLERFRNPFLIHKISDILVYHDEKVKIRLMTTRDEYRAKFGKTPPLLDEAIRASAGLGASAAK